MSRRRSRLRGERGYVIPFTALALIPLLVISALAIDVGGFYADASRLQRAADAAALAGVVWMPDFDEAKDVAIEAAARNGFVHDPTGSGVRVDVTSPGAQKLTVSISAPGDLFLGRLVRSDIALARDATAEYVLPVPLGSPRNFFGTGTLATGVSENLYLAVNPWCTDKVDGDRFQSRYNGNRPYGNLDANCPMPVPASSTILNDEYRSTGYELYVEVPAGTRPAAIEVLLFDARYQTGSGACAGCDLEHFEDAEQDFRFTLFGADATPLDDRDNTVYEQSPGVECRATYTPATAFQAPAINFLGSTRWNRLCTIPTTALAGRYILRVTNTPDQRFEAGVNGYGVVARYTNLSYTTASLCDGRVSSTCPRVFGKRDISVYAPPGAASASANFFLSEIDPAHTGKTLEISLFDPGEGGSTIAIRRPTGTTGNSWTDQSFTWEASDGSSGGPTTSLDVTSSRFNGDLVTITVDLSGYSPPSNNRWWQIRYVFTSGTVQDRTTWGVVVKGDPVHLVE